MIYRAAATIVAVFALALTAGLAWFVYQTPGSVYSDEPERHAAPIATGGAPVNVTVQQGESAKAIGSKLQELGVIRSRRLFEVLVGLTGVQNSLEAGEYEFDPGTTAIEAVRRIASGRTASRSVLVPEGRRIEEVAAIVEKAGLTDQQSFSDALNGAFSEKFLQARACIAAQNSGACTFEGYLFPARYEFSRGAKAEQIVDAMLQGFQTNVADKIQLEGQNLTLSEVVTLASIVEREAATASERPIIASVFLNRLKAGIPLQADPTVQYAIARDNDSVAKYGWWKKALTLDDLKVDSPYNTYTNAGLPPEPIANPGLDSIEAVIRPAQTNYLFFVAKNDGTHVFAETLQEHQRNVDQYQQ